MVILIFGGDEHRLDHVGQELRRAGFVPMAAVGDHPLAILRDVADVALVLIIGADAVTETSMGALLERHVPVVIVAPSSILREHPPMPSASVLLPEDTSAWEIASACLALTGRRVRLDEPATIDAGPVTLDLIQECAYVDGQPVELPPKEFALLKQLMLEDGHPLSSEELLRRIWSEDQPATADDVHRHIYRLRERIGDQRRAEPLIVNRRGYGYAVARPLRGPRSGAPTRTH